MFQCVEYLLLISCQTDIIKDITKPVAFSTTGYGYILHVTLADSWAIPPSTPMDYCFARDAIEDTSLEETRGAISPLGAVAPQGNPKNPICYLQRGIPNIWTTGPAPPSSNAQHLCKPGDAASLLGQRIHPHCRVILRSCFSRLFFFFFSLQSRWPGALFIYLTKAEFLTNTRNWGLEKHHSKSQELWKKPMTWQRYNYIQEFLDLRNQGFRKHMY